MDSLIVLYQKRLNLQGASFLRIGHQETIVAVVYKVVEPSGAASILKICDRVNDYLREVYFLKHFAKLLPVPHIIKTLPPEPGIPGAILMECLPGRLLENTDLTEEAAFELGSLLARIHLNRASGYGDLVQTQNLNSDPGLHFGLKFEEGLDECKDNLPDALIERCRSYFDSHSNVLAAADGPCMIQRDFRAGNVIISGGKIQGIIDWSSARSGFAQEDFCPLEHGEWPCIPGTREAFLTGYASVRPVPDYQAMMPLLRISRAVAVLGCIVKRGIWDGIHAKLYQSNRQFLETFFRGQSGFV